MDCDHLLSLVHQDIARFEWCRDYEGLSTAKLVTLVVILGFLASSPEQLSSVPDLTQIFSLLITLLAISRSKPTIWTYIFLL